ncbi:hypothetical protein CISIN_1g002225mg [Citrus sinensis]|uniref:WPP domain-associated protein n=1 Tax=Citrus sinensis TaxID=2711 RepID=A0A067G6K9_CITSI|nr:hypothetical protein CISIN_1g002225mg [Citrus sinensis]
MSMEVSPTALEGSCGVVNGSVCAVGDESVMIDNNVEENENPANLVEDFDSYWDDINDRLTISRMVSDSVIKGMVNAIEQEAAEKIAEKELELVRLRESLHLYHVGAEESEPFQSLVMKHESGSVKHGSYSSLSDYDKIGESVGGLKNVAKEQLKNLRKEIDRIKGCSSLRRIGSGSEMVGLGGILQDKVSDIRWMDVDKALDSLRTTLDTIFNCADNTVYLSKASLCQWQQEKEFQGEIEDMVIMNCFRSLKEEFEERLCDQSAQFYDNESLNWLGKIKEISSLREELNAISKSLSVSEIGHLTSHGSIEMGEEWDTNKWTDHLHRKTSSNHVGVSTSPSEGNGKHDESIIVMSENLDSNLKHMSKEELVNHFKAEMTKMKRIHELKVTEMTEDLFALKREYLKERGSSLPIKKDKEFDILRKKIPEVLSKLDDILVENEKLPAFSENAEGLCNFKDRLESLLLENRQLRSLLTDKKNEVKRLSLKVSDTAEIMLQRSLTEENLVKRIGNLQGALDDAHIEASITEGVYKCLLGEAADFIKSVSKKSDLEYELMQEVYEIIFSDAAHNATPLAEENLVKRIGNLQGALDDANIEASISEGVYKCLLREAVDSIKSVSEKSDLEYELMQEVYGIIFSDAAHNATPGSTCAFEDCDMESVIMQDLYEVIFREALKEAEVKLNELNQKYFMETELRRLEVAEKEKLKQETRLLSSLVEEKENLVSEAVATLLEEKDLSKSLSQELSHLRDETSRQQILISKSSKEFNDLKGNLTDALEQIEQYKLEVHDLKQKLELAMKELRDTNEETRKQVQLLVIFIQGLSKTVADFECRAVADIERCNFRLDSLSSQSKRLILKANVITRTGLSYKQKLERRCSDLQKAEAEVDLLGDEVDTLSGLLEKIYIALDHYSSVLQHYPGVSFFFFYCFCNFNVSEFSFNDVMSCYQTPFKGKRL